MPNIEEAAQTATPKAIAELRDLVNEVIAKLLVMSEQGTRTREDVNRNEKAIKDIGDSQRRLEVAFAIVQDRLARSESDIKTTSAFVRENWTKIAEMGAVVAMLTKLSGLW